MVRREGTRFGLATSHNVRRLPFPYKQLYSRQSIVVKTKIDGEDHQVKKSAKAAVKRQMENGAFNIKDDTEQKRIHFSLNKAKRWEVIEGIRDEEEYYGNRSIITEHHMLKQGRDGRKCTGVYDSSVSEVPKSPKKKYTAATDVFVGRQTDGDVIGNDDDFGKKNRWRSRRRRKHHDEEDALPSTVWYDVTLAPPRQTLQTYCNSADSGKPKRNSRNRTCKLHQCSMQEFYSYSQWEFDEDFTLDWEEKEEQYWHEDTKDAEPYQVCTDALEVLVTKAMMEPHRHGELRRTSWRHQEESQQTMGTKDQVFLVDKEDVMVIVEPQLTDDVPESSRKKTRNERRQERLEAEEKEAVRQLNEIKEKKKREELAALRIKASVDVSVETTSISLDALCVKFGENYTEGLCTPRRFAINITNSIIDHLQTSAKGDALASSLLQSGHHVSLIVDCMLDPWLSVKEDDSLVEDIRVKLCGVTEDREMLSECLTGLDVCNIADVVHAVSSGVATLSSERYLFEKSNHSLPCKPAFAMEITQSTLGWRYYVTNPNKAVQKALQHKDAEDCETGDHTPSGSSSECGYCNICYEELSENCPGTALLACSHWFCDQCWSSHMMSRVEQGDLRIACPGYQCTSLVDEVTMMSFLPATFFARHLANKVNTALMLQPELHWCPSPSCGRLLKVASQKTDVGKGGVVPISCECGSFWCSECKKEAHWPASCEQAEAYRKKAAKLLRSRQLSGDLSVRVPTKRCPNCFYPIEKEYGCYYMQCKCGYEFCWDCGAKADHYGHRCVRKIWSTQVYTIRPVDLVVKSTVELAAGHYRQRTHFACHRRIRKARKLASRVNCETKEESDSDDTVSLSSSSSSSSSSVSTATRDRQPSPFLQKIRGIMKESADFLSEAEFVLENLEIFLANAPPSSRKTNLSEHRTRLIYITDILHRIFNEEDKLDINKVQHLLHCGKSCLSWVALSAVHLTNAMASNACEE
ncbi:uncharacterized protein [Diadema setosum]|uniref:uncharacterized protein n=1 Tax=Diadema setosum TaxID=31175 RepID=UPI003B3A0F0F